MPVASSKSPSRWARIAAVCGPGLVVMLADTDAGSIITAAQSGAQWGYRLLLLQIILIPVLFILQELTVRLGIVEKRGHGEMIAAHFGRVWAWTSVGTLALACGGALLSELSGIAGVGLMMGIPAPLTVSAVVAILAVMAFTGSYSTVERIAFGLGLFELVFIVAAWRSHPHAAVMLSQSLDIPYASKDYLYLVAANIGAVVMPWMVFYQQSAVVEKGLTLKDLKLARWDTAVGAVITQVVMCAVLIAAAALGTAGHGIELNTVQQISAALSPVLGPAAGSWLFGFGLAGAAMVATIVVTLTVARAIGELLGFKRGLDYSVKEAPWFYVAYALVLVAGGVLVCSGTNLVRLSVGVQVMNALLLPIVLGFLFLLARRLPPEHRLRGLYSWVVLGVILVTAGFGVFAAIAGVL